jgi:hypothetical protein
VEGHRVPPLAVLEGRVGADLHTSSGRTRVYASGPPWPTSCPIRERGNSAGQGWSSPAVWSSPVSWWRCDVDSGRIMPTTHSSPASSGSPRTRVSAGRGCPGPRPGSRRRSPRGAPCTGHNGDREHTKWRAGGASATFTCAAAAGAEPHPQRGVGRGRTGDLSQRAPPRARAGQRRLGVLWVPARAGTVPTAARDVRRRCRHRDASEPAAPPSTPEMQTGGWNG